MIGLLAALALAAAPAPAAPPAPVELTAPGPQGALAGTLLDPGPAAPLVVIIPGSGPTDRDGDSPAGVKGGALRQLAEGLAARGVASLRIDKRGMFGSKAAVADANHVTTADYADDAQAWSKVARDTTGRRCVWLLGHSEGGLVALFAAQRPEGLCGLILLSTVGEGYGGKIRAQFAAAPGAAPLLPEIDATIAALEAGRHVPEATLSVPLRTIFPDVIQDYMIDLFSHDPLALAAATRLPVLIVQGTRDIQVSVADAEALKRAQPRATLTLVPGMNHVLKPVASDDRAANVAAYGDATLAIVPEVAAAVAGFVRR